MGRSPTRPRALFALRVSELKEVTRLCLPPICSCAALSTRSFHIPSSDLVPPRPRSLPCALAGPGAAVPSMPRVLLL